MAEIASALPKGRLIRPLQIMVVDDESIIRGPLALCLETLGHQVVEAATVEDAMVLANRIALDLALVDLRLGTSSGLDLMTQLLAIHARLKIIIITAYASVDIAVRAMARGAADFLCKPFTPDQVAGAVARAASLQDLESDVGIITDRWGTAGPEADFATTCARLQSAVMTARRVAPTDTPILITGEPGTGKGILARAIHGWSKSADGPFESVDCSARSPAYVDLTLFGETLAGEKVIKGEEAPLIQRASGGTLLIKHMELLSPRSQDRLAHMLEVTAPDSSERKRSTVPGCRIIVTSGASTAASQDSLLPALLDRVRIHLPALRERAFDIPMLAQRYLGFARQYAEKPTLGFSTEALERLIAYPWPDNLRELHQVIVEAFTTCNSAYIEPCHFRPSIRDARMRRIPRAGDKVSLQDLEAAHIREVIASTKTLHEAAEVLGLDLQALYRRRRQFGLE
jgi:NtrC-family two-component system response regulator AlgB